MVRSPGAGAPSAPITSGVNGSLSGQSRWCSDLRLIRLRSWISSSSTLHGPYCRTPYLGPLGCLQVDGIGDEKELEQVGGWQEVGGLVRGVR
jgi:hypothetical protein